MCSIELNSTWKNPKALQNPSELAFPRTLLNAAASHVFDFGCFRRPAQAQSHRAAPGGHGDGAGVLGQRGAGGGPALEGVPHRGPGAPRGHEGHRALQEGHQSRRSVISQGGQAPAGAQRSGILFNIISLEIWNVNMLHV